MPSTLYHSGAILTMEGNDPGYAEALVVADGVIRHVGSRADADAMRPDRTVDLAGKALLPGFIDAHGHIIVAAHHSECRADRCRWTCWSSPNRSTWPRPARFSPRMAGSTSTACGSVA